MKESLNLTPMMKQFCDLKEQYNDCILLFRAGDFYETFYEDAKIVSKVLSITLTQRAGTPMAGVPYHSINPYIKKLIQNDFKVAICEQLENPKDAKGIVKRGVTRVITPGTILEDEYLSSSDNNYIFCVYVPNNISEKFAVAIADITTKDFITTEFSTRDDLNTLIKRYLPNEIILNESSFFKDMKSFMKNLGIYHNYLSDLRFNYNYSAEILKKQFNKNINQLGLEDKKFSVIASGTLLYYIYKLQKIDLSHIYNIEYLNMSKNMFLDFITLRNLEIIEPLFNQDKNSTLISTLNNTKTVMGARLLKKHLINPLNDLKEIEKRYDLIDEFNNNIFLRNDLRNLLDNFYDIERIASRISLRIATPKDLYSLRLVLEKLPSLKEKLSFLTLDIGKEIKSIELLEDACKILYESISENAQSHTREIGYIKKNYNKELKDLLELAFNSKNYLKDLEEQEKQKTGISTLKIRYNKIFGYFIEIPKSQEAKVPSDYIIRQTLVNACRYTKEELKQKEDQILGAEEKARILEKEIFDSIVEYMHGNVKKIQQVSEKIALLDVMLNHSYNAQIYNYCKPVFSKESSQIKNGRNPIVERFVREFISNDSEFVQTDYFKIITGPNMSGKSTYLRQVALISIMAQIGSFVPADYAKLKIYDRIFTRIGAHDELAKGQSTFMVEMSETANILNNVTENSLVLLDEIGRGTSTYDGLAIAWAVTEFLVAKKCDCMFATHYHQLNKLEDFYPGIKNYNILVKEENDEIEFIRKIVIGGTDKSYGIHVGKLAGIPKEVLNRAKEVQQNIENNEQIIINKEFYENIKQKTTLNNNKKLINNKKLNEFL